MDRRVFKGSLFRLLILQRTLDPSLDPVTVVSEQDNRFAFGILVSFRHFSVTSHTYGPNYFLIPVER